MEFVYMQYVDLQRFAQAGDNVIGTAANVNAYTGVQTAQGPKNTMSPTMKVYYDTELLENARNEHFFAQFGRKQPLPRGRGKTIEWRKFNTLPNAERLTEGVIPTGKDFGMTTLVSGINQYGMYITISDQLELHAIDDIILGATEELGASAGETQDVAIRNVLMEGTNVMYADTLDENGDPTGETPAGRWQLTKANRLTPQMVNKAVTLLKKLKAPRINGKYICLIHPSVTYDLREDKKWNDVHKYSATTEIFNGEIGELHGVRFIENVFAPILDGEYANKAGGVTYATYFFGKDAFGIIDPEGGALEMIVKSKEQAGGPLNQYSTIGYKFETNGATILYPERVLRVMSCSSFSATDDVN